LRPRRSKAAKPTRPLSNRCGSAMELVSSGSPGSACVSPVVECVMSLPRGGDITS
jgi:hypothetical protein